MKASRAFSNRVKVFTALVSFVAGAVIYLLYRPSSLLGFSVIGHLGLAPVAEGLRSWASPCPWPDWVIYCLPNGLWSLAYVLVVDACMHFCTTRGKCLFAAVIPALGCLSELLQLAGTLPGTFDSGDLLCYSTPLLLYYACFASPKLERKNYRQNKK